MRGVENGKRLEVNWEQHVDREEDKANGKALAELIQECWNQDPTKRPKMVDVVARLEGMQPCTPLVVSSHTGIVLSC